MDRKAFAAVVLAAVLVLAGCSAPYTGSGSPSDDGSARPDPPEDRLGWENGYWHNESIDVDASDGLNDSELERVTARMMARLEVLRGLEFERDVSVRVVSESAYRNRSDGAAGGSDDVPWLEQYYEASFLVGENRSALGALDEAPLGGFFDPDERRITLVTDRSDGLRVDRNVLAHELAHALQYDTLLDRESDTVPPLTVTEGEADYLEALYADRCGDRWDCIEGLDSPSVDEVDLDELDYDVGMAVASQFPYAEGPDFVAAVRERGGWAAVNDLYRNPPASAEQVIHPERYPDDDPADVTVPDRSGEDWEPTIRGVSLGEARLYTMLWDNGIVPQEDIFSDDVGGGDYSHPYTDGWNGDLVVPYTNGSAYGYVFVSRWETEADAREFLAAYRDVLASHDARAVGDGVYRIPEDDAFGDAFRVEREGTTVVVVNAPTVAALDDVRSENASAARPYSSR